MLKRLVIYTFLIFILGYYFFPWIIPVLKHYGLLSHVMQDSRSLPLPSDKSQPLGIDTQSIYEEQKKLFSTNRIPLLFSQDKNRQLPIVETISYTSVVPWMSDRLAWISDYANHYETSCHFIARSLNHKANYKVPNISTGQKFNVLKKDRKIEFHLIVDLSQSQLAFYCLDIESKDRIFLRNYQVGLGRKSGDTGESLTPKGRFLLGNKVAIYRPETKGFFRDQYVEMITVFGTRWIPFERNIDKESFFEKGIGIHGLPWKNNAMSHESTEMTHLLGAYESDGCIHMQKDDVEELFSIIITKPTIVEIVNHFEEAAFFTEKVCSLTSA